MKNCSAVNRKIKNASVISYNGIEFKSSLEKTIYKTLVDTGLSPSYESHRFILWDGYTPTIRFYNKGRLEMSKIRDITYTPDFVLTHKGVTYIIEAKGFENDIFPLKKKLFRKLLESYPIPVVYYEIHNKKDLQLLIDNIKNGEDTAPIKCTPKKRLGTCTKVSK